MKGLKFKSNNSIKTKSIILSVVTIIELIALLLTMTFAWFEGLTSLEIKGENLSTAGGLKSKFIVGEGTDYQTTAELNEFFHKQSFDKLSPVSSMDGDNFYAITTGETPESQADYITAVQNNDITFRQLSEEEKLSSIVYFQFEISSDSSDTDFWFKKLPAVKINGTELNSENNPFRFSIDDGTGANPSMANNYIFSTCTQWPGNNRANMRAVKSIDANGYATLNASSELITNLAESCVFGTESNNDGQYKLFTVPKGQSKIITIAIWIEAFDPAYNENIIPPGATVAIDIQFCSSWDVVDEMVFRDFTSDQWIDTVDEKQSNKSMKFGAANLDSPDNYYYPFEYDSANKQWTADVPRAVQNIKFIWQGANDTTNEDNTWSPVTRGSKKIFTAFGSSAGIWYDGDVDRITFSDYTGTKWVDDNLDGSTPKMRVQVTYEGSIMDYSMTDAPTTDGAGRSVWSMFMPTAVNDVVFNRCSRADDSTAKNTWEAPDRNGETRYFALDGGEVEVIEGTAIYLNVLKDFNDIFYYNSFTPAVSKMSDTNRDLILARRDAGTLASLPKNSYVLSTSSHGDDWPGEEGKMTKAYEDDDRIVWVFYFDYNLPDNTYLTFWNRTQYNANSDYNNIDRNVSFAPAVLYKKSTGNQWTIYGDPGDYVTLTDSQFNNCRLFDNGKWGTYTGEGGNTTIPGEKQVGQWGPPTTLPTGTYQTYFMHTSPVEITSVTAKFEYYGTEYTVNMTQSSEPHKWYTTLTEIPDDVTSITFTDSAGNTWTSATSDTRTKTTPYYYATSSSAGKWSGKIDAPSGSYKTYFVPPSGNTASTVKATFVYNDVYFTVNLTKGTDGNWSTQAIPDGASNIVFRDNLNHTWATGSGRTSTNCYYMTTSNTAGAWGKPATATKTIYLVPNDNWKADNAWFWVHAWGGEETVDVKMTAVSGQSGVYSVEIPEDSTQIIFVRMNPAYSNIDWNNGKWNQTVDLTIPSDSDTFTITSSTNGTWYEVEEPEPASNVVYLKPNSNWTSANAWFAIYVWDGTGNEKWVKMEASSTSGVYQCEIPDGYSTNIIFCRMNPASTSLGWSNVWNQTNDLTIQTNGNNMYTVASGTWSKGGGTWGKFS